VDAGPPERVLPGTAVRVSVEGHDAALANIGGHLVAVGDLCMRCGHSLADGDLSGSRLTCRECGWQYDLLDRTVVGVPKLRIESLEVRVEDGRVLVGLERVSLRER
jgi:nitrite reductase/ring-hydroxylating ferredoxin subunit